MKLPEINTCSAPLTFEVSSGALRVTDPCYSPGVWCSGQVENVLNGNWYARVGYHQDDFDQKQSAKFIARLREELAQDRQRFVDSIMEFNPTREPISESELDDIFAVKKSQIDEQEEAVKNDPGRVAFIQIAHASLPFSQGAPDPNTYEQVKDLDVGVDSGQAGFFDLAQYVGLFANPEEDKRGMRVDHSAFYRQICELTLSETEQFGVVPFGVVTRSGYGDGGYNLFVKRDEMGQMVGAMIVFISEDDELEGEECSTEDAPSA